MIAGSIRPERPMPEEQVVGDMRLDRVVFASLHLLGIGSIIRAMFGEHTGNEGDSRTIGGPRGVAYASGYFAHRAGFSSLQRHDPHL